MTLINGHEPSLLMIHGRAAPAVLAHLADGLAAGHKQAEKHGEQSQLRMITNEIIRARRVWLACGLHVEHHPVFMVIHGCGT
jgi:hypothetical protein